MSRTVRIVAVVAALLVVGTLAFAAAEATQAPRASQIPTVITSNPTAVSVTTTAPAETSATPAAVPAAQPAQAPAATSPDSHPSEPREVVTPKVRDDGDGDNGKEKHEGAEDESDSGTTAHAVNVQSGMSSPAQSKVPATISGATSAKESGGGPSRTAKSSASETAVSMSRSRN